MDQEYMLVSDDDGHWYVISVEQEEEFELFVSATNHDADWEGFDFETLSVGGAPGSVRFKQYRIVF